MALDDIPQLDEIDDVLDDLESPTSLEVYEAMLPYDNDMVTAAVGQRAVNGGGGSGGSQPTVTRVPFAFDTANLVGQPGILVYTPTAREILLLGAVAVLTAFDGNQPTGVLQFAGQAAGDGVATGIDMTSADAAISGTGDGSTLMKFADYIANTATVGAGAHAWFSDATPLRFYIDDDNGGDPGSTQGTGEIVIVTLAAP